MPCKKIPKKEPVYKIKVKFDKGKNKIFTFETHLPKMFKKGENVVLNGRPGIVVKKTRTNKMSRL